MLAKFLLMNTSRCHQTQSLQDRYGKTMRFTSSNLNIYTENTKSFVEGILTQTSQPGRQSS